MWTFGFMKFFYGTNAKIAALHFVHTVTQRPQKFVFCYFLKKTDMYSQMFQRSGLRNIRFRLFRPLCCVLLLI